MRERRPGTLLCVGSTIIVTTPPFLGPYVASKAAFDALAVVTSYEAAQFGIETTVAMPGAITEGMLLMENHRPCGWPAAGVAVTQQRCRPAPPSRRTGSRNGL